MSNYTTIEEFNVYASEYLTNLTINEYINKIHKLFNKDLDISFMEYFTDIIKHRNEFYIHHNKLKECGVINNIKSSHIKDCLNQFNMIENEDYQMLNVKQLRPQGGTSETKVYHLTPKSFKICLMRAKNTKKYAFYYFF